MRRARALLRATAACCVASFIVTSASLAYATFEGHNGRIAFARVTARGVNISSIRPDGSGRTIVVHRWFSRAPAWSADGASIAFMASDGGAPDELFTARADGSDVTRLTRDDEIQAWPAWSPDGDRIAFVIEGRRREYEIATIRADGTDLIRLTRHSGGSSDPDWSPDGTRIAYDVDGQIASMSPRGRGAQIVTTDGGFEPSWSPNGRWIAFSDDGDIYRIRPDGSALTRLTSTPIEEGSPSWSPNGARIAYLRSRSNDERSTYMAAIWIVDADGSDPIRIMRRVSGNQFPLEPPAWQPR